MKTPSKRARTAPQDQPRFMLCDESYAAFLKVLDEPVAPNAKLKRLMASKAPWEE